MLRTDLMMVSLFSGRTSSTFLPDSSALNAARAAAVRDPELKEGLAKPLYEETLTVLDQDPSNKEKAATKRVYIEAYKYLGYYNYLQTTNPAKKNEAIAATKDYWNKMLELDPGNTEILEALKTLDSL